MKNKQKGSAVTLLLGIIALLLIGGGVYIYSTRNDQANSPIINTTLQGNPGAQTSADSNQNIPASQSSAFSASPSSGVAPLTVQFTQVKSAGDVSIDYGDGTSCSTADPDGTEGCSVFTHTYATAGIYTATIYRHLPTMEIGSTTVTVTGTASAASLVGMQQYTDPQFGFSFWYPSSWILQVPSEQKSYLAISGGTVIKTVMVGPAGDLNNSILVQAITSSGEGITDDSPAGPAGNGSLSLTYFFNPSSHTWMAQDTDGSNHTTTYAANVSTNTMGGLHLLGGNARFGDDVIIPLSAQNFLVVSSVDAGTIAERFLAQTITATDPSVATPVSQAQQTQTIQTEANAYATGSDIH